MNNEKKEYLEKMVGKEVAVVTNGGGWLGKVIKVLDEETVVVQDGKKRENVSIYDIRSI